MRTHRTQRIYILYTLKKIGRIKSLTLSLPIKRRFDFYTLRNLMLQVRVSSYLFPRTRPNNIIYLGMILYYLRIIVILIIQNIYLI